MKSHSFELYLSIHWLQ